MVKEGGGSESGWWFRVWDSAGLGAVSFTGVYGAEVVALVWKYWICIQMPMNMYNE